jgi:hypothetical protein
MTSEMISMDEIQNVIEEFMTTQKIKAVSWEYKGYKYELKSDKLKEVQ